MAAERFVLLGLARARSAWFGAVAQWAHSGTVPVEFVKCVSPEELRARLASGRPFSAVLVDAALPALDRDLVEAARRAACPCIAVDDRRGGRDPAALGVVAVLPHALDPKALLDTLRAHAVMIGRGDALPGGDAAGGADAGGGLVAVVCGPGGTGASTVAIGLAQSVAERPGASRVLLADLALHAEQAMLHDARDVVPGVQEVAEAFRAGALPDRDVRALAFHVEDRGYDLLLGLRRARAWASVRPRAFEAAFAGLRRSYDVVVCDTDADLEGEEESGSVEVEERHVMARTAVRHAHVVFAVGLGGMKGLHSLVRVLEELRGAGVAPGRVVPVVNRAPRSGRSRAETAATLAALAGGVPTGPPVFLPERRVDDALRDGVRLPAALTAPLAGAFAALAEDGGPARDVARRVRPGSLGWWADEDERVPG